MVWHDYKTDPWNSKENRFEACDYRYGWVDFEEYYNTPIKWTEVNLSEVE